MNVASMVALRGRRSLMRVIMTALPILNAHCRSMITPKELETRPVFAHEYPATAKIALLGEGTHSIQVHIQDAELGGKVAWLGLPGLPFRQGHVELSLTPFRGDDYHGTEENVFTDLLTYVPIAERADLKYTLPDQPAGDYELRVKLFLYGFVADTEPNRAASVYTVRLTYKEPTSGIPPGGERLEPMNPSTGRMALDGYALSSAKISPDKDAELRLFLNEYNRADVTVQGVFIVGHSCDRGTPHAKWRISTERASAVEKVVMEVLGVPATIRSQGDEAFQEDVLAGAITDPEKQRPSYRRVDIQVKYTVGSRGDGGPQ